MTTAILSFLLKKYRLLRNDVPYFNPCSGDGLIVEKRPGTIATINDQKAPELAKLIDQPNKRNQAFGAPKPFTATSMRQW